eukprot:CAMPEP_0203788146 /NCGR_PEP_ID=MMETSP0100_2-20121128/2665_1 /ASSEMBLY_ACC=CAM_ASM_000210 /TAXON_ID=96639 /ORGANISM=" , Strain NY0313808BC1" /LENGTH=39 /DNA_ID= /DNA_START= /DNA_END= /DNA_ORIENTATION=
MPARSDAEMNTPDFWVNFVWNKTTPIMLNGILFIEPTIE